MQYGIYCEKRVSEEVLLSGHHKNIERYRREMSLMSTLSKREDLFMDIELTKDDIKYLKHINEILTKKLGEEPEKGRKL